MSINRVTISGNLTREPELRQTAGGTSVLTFGIAVNDRIKNSQTGEWEDYPNFLDCTMFGTRAESVSNYLAKGAKVAIAGKLRWSSWERDGQKRSKVEIIVDDLEFMSRGQQATQQPQQAQPPVYAAPAAPAAQARPQQPRQPQQAQMPVPPQPQYVAPSVYDEDIPF